MRPQALFSQLLVVAGALLGVGAVDVRNYAMGSNGGSFSGATFSSSAGGNANCVSGTLNIAASASNVQLRLTAPANQSAVTEFFVEMQQSGRNYMLEVTGGPQPVSGTWSIYVKFCVPVTGDGSTVKTVQLLTHGATLDNTYWDFAPGYSYVDAAAKAGYATLNYDRLGTGKSQHPDPVQTVQSNLQVEIMHQLVLALRGATYNGAPAFNKVVGVGHSAGATFTQGETFAYPKDFDALILSGTSASLLSLNAATASFATEPANAESRFRSLPNGYFTQGAVPQAVQFAFWRYPFYDQNIFTKYFQTRQTNTAGELLTLGSLVKPVPTFTGPVDVINGVNDFVFCGGDCNFPADQARAFLTAFYPAAAAGSQTYLQPQAGHVNAGHYTAPQGFAQMISFLKANGL